MNEIKDSIQHKDLHDIYEQLVSSLTIYRLKPPHQDSLGCDEEPSTTKKKKTAAKSHSVLEAKWLTGQYSLVIAH